MLVGPRCLHLRRTSRSRFLTLSCMLSGWSKLLRAKTPPYLRIVLRFIGDKLLPRLGSCFARSFSLLEDGWREVPTPHSMLGVTAGCICRLVVCAIPGCMSPLVICDSVARGCWQHVSFVGTPAAAHSWGLDTYAKSHFLGILRQLERNWQAQDINDSERPSLKTCLFAWQLAACPIKTQRGTSPAGEPSFHLAESNPSPNRTCIHRHCPSSITRFQIPPRFPLSLAHLFRLLLEGTTGCVTFCGECQRKQGKTN